MTTRTNTRPRRSCENVAPRSEQDRRLVPIRLEPHISGEILQGERVFLCVRRNGGATVLRVARRLLRRPSPYKNRVPDIPQPLERGIGRSGVSVNLFEKEVGQWFR